MLFFTGLMSFDIFQKVLYPFPRKKFGVIRYKYFLSFFFLFWAFFFSFSNLFYYQLILLLLILFFRFFDTFFFLSI